MDSSPSNIRARASEVTTQESDFCIEVASTSELQKWMSSIEKQLNEVCIIATEGKLNSDQKLKITNLSRKIGSGVSHMAVLYQQLKQKANQAMDIIDNLREKRDLAEDIIELKDSIKDSVATKNFSFADMVKKGPDDFVQPKKLNSVAIYPENKLKTSDETKTLLQKIIRPDKMKIHVRGVRKTQNGGVIISTDSKQDAEKVKQAVHQSSSGLVTGEPNKRQPRITVVGVPTSLANTDVMKFIYEQNVAEKFPEMAMETFLTAIKLSHKSGRKDASTCNFVIEVPAKIRKALIAQERIYINWNSCPVRDFTLVTRCYRCQQYGHAAKSCRDVPSCGNCGLKGHITSECTKKVDAPICASCSRFNKPNKHKTGDAECPARKIAQYKYINSIDYEGA